MKFMAWKFCFALHRKQSLGSGFQSRNFVQSFLSNNQGPQERCCLFGSSWIWWKLMVNTQAICVSQFFDQMSWPEVSILVVFIGWGLNQHFGGLMRCLLIVKIPFLYGNPQFVMKQLGSGRADNGVQLFTDTPCPQYLMLPLVLLLLIASCWVPSKSWVLSRS